MKAELTQHNLRTIQIAKSLKKIFKLERSSVFIHKDDIALLDKAIASPNELTEEDHADFRRLQRLSGYTPGQL